jgi:hypothetical protein
MNIVGNVNPFVTLLSITQPHWPLSNPLQGVNNAFPAPATPPKNFAFQAPVASATQDTSHQSLVTPLVWNWNLLIEHQFAAGWLTCGACVGTNGSHLREWIQLNPAVYTPGSTLSAHQRRLFSGTAWSIKSPWTWTPFTMACNSVCKSGGEKWFLPWPDLLANYTFSKAIDDLPTAAGVEAAGVSAIPWYKAGRSSLDRGVSDCDRTHAIVVSYHWQLPSFAGTARLARALLGSW